jgi:hypothetical protein
VTDAVFEARSSPWRLRLLALLSLGFVAIGVWMVSLGGGAKETIFGWLGILFFGPGAFVIARRSFDSGLVLRVDASGIWSKNWSDATIPWDAVADVHFWTMQRQRMIGLELVEPQIYPAKGLVGRLSGANRALTGVDAIWLNVTGTDGNFDDLARTVLHHHRAG